MKDRRPPLYLFTGIVIGLAIGFLIAYVLLPVRYSDTAPSMLNSTQKDVYRALVGRTYLYETDSGRAFSRLSLLQDPDLNAALVSEAQQIVAQGGDTSAARGLALLSAAINQPNQVITPLAQATDLPQITQSVIATIPQLTNTPPASTTPQVSATPQYSPTPVLPTSTPFATFTPRPTSTPKPTQGAPFALSGQKTICDNPAESALLMVEVYDAEGNGVPGVMIEISLPNGGSTDFYTGLYPEINSGYADYAMSPEVTYSLRVGIGGNVVTGLSIPQCSKSDGSSYSGGLLLTFKQQ